MSENPEDRRDRTIRWNAAVDVLAKKLAAERNLERGVSELLERLVMEEAVNPKLPLSPSYREMISRNEQLASQVQDLAGKVLKKRRKKD